MEPIGADWEIRAAAFEALAILSKMAVEYNKDEECVGTEINRLIEDGEACLLRFRHLVREATGNCPVCYGRGVFIDYIQFQHGLRCLYVRCDCGAPPIFTPEHDPHWIAE